MTEAAPKIPEAVTRALKDGRGILLRAVLPEDRAAVLAAFHRLSAKSRARRFLREIAEPSEAMLRYLTEVDHTDHVAICAILESPDLKSEEAVGVARFVRLKDEPRVAEAAVTVIDAFQHLGAGRALLERLSELAIERGIHRFRSEVLKGNEPMRRILELAGASVVAKGDDTLLFEADLGFKEPEGFGLLAMFREIAKWRFTV